MRVEFEFLGTGTSYGVPAIGCECHVCASTNPRNKRMRSSIVIHVSPERGRQRSFLVDVSTDLRSQALRARLKRIDGVLFTHEHADHTHGLDDLRAFYWHNGKKDIPAWCLPETLASLRRRFDYLFDRELEYRGVTRLEEHVFEFEPFEAAGVEVIPIPLVHGSMRVAAFRIGEFAYLTDTNRVPPSSIEKLKGVKLMVIDALRRAPHPTHMSLPEAMEVCRKVGVEQAWFTHINHDLDHEEVDNELPEWAHLGYDTLRVAIEGGKIEVVGDRLGEISPVFGDVG